MSGVGRVEIRRIAEKLLSDYARFLDTRHRGQPLSAGLLGQAAREFLTSPDFTGQLPFIHQRLLDAAEEELLRRKRRDPFLRLMTHPMSRIFEEEQLSREILVNYFSFLHLVLGDMRDTLGRRSQEILEDLQKSDPLDFSWDNFYGDSRAKQVFWVVIVRIAESFRRFDARRDWFIGLMQNHPQAVSLGPNVFLPRQTPEEAPPFGKDEFNLMFGALFAPMRELSPGERLAFQRDFGAGVDQVLGTIFAELEASGALFPA